MSIIVDKTEYLAVCKTQNANVVTSFEVVPRSNVVKYPGAFIGSSGACEVEIETRCSRARWRHTRDQLIYQVVLEVILMYRTKTWSSQRDLDNLKSKRGGPLCEGSYSS